MMCHAELANPSSPLPSPLPSDSSSTTASTSATRPPLLAAPLLNTAPSDEVPWMLYRASPTPSGSPIHPTVLCVTLPSAGLNRMIRSSGQHVMAVPDWSNRSRRPGFDSCSGLAGFLKRFLGGPHPSPRLIDNHKNVTSKWHHYKYGKSWPLRIGVDHS